MEGTGCCDCLDEVVFVHTGDVNKYVNQKLHLFVGIVWLDNLC